MKKKIHAMEEVQGKPKGYHIALAFEFQQGRKHADSYYSEIGDRANKLCLWEEEAKVMRMIF